MRDYLCFFIYKKLKRNMDTEAILSADKFQVDVMIGRARLLSELKTNFMSNLMELICILTI